MKGGMVFLAALAICLAVLARFANGPPSPRLLFIPAAPPLPGFGGAPGRPSCAAQLRPARATPETLQATPLCLLGGLVIYVCVAERRKKAVRGSTRLRAKVRKFSLSEIDKRPQQLLNKRQAPEHLMSSANLPNYVRTTVNSSIDTVNSAVADVVNLSKVAKERFEELAPEVQNTVLAVVSFPSAAKEKIDVWICTVHDTVDAVVGFPAAAKKQLDSSLEAVKNVVDAVVAFPHKLQERTSKAIHDINNTMSSMVEAATSLKLVLEYLVGSLQFFATKGPENEMEAYESFLLPVLRKIDEQSSQASDKAKP